MKIKLKKVYYCDFCKKHGLTSWAIKKHEKHCTLNPNRECGLCDKKGVDKEGIKFIQKAYKKMKSHQGKDGASEDGIIGTFVGKFEEAVKKLAKDLGCPVCTFSVLRQSEIGLHWMNYDFKEEMKKYWEEEAKKEEEREYYSNLI